MAEINFGLLTPQTGPTEYEQMQARTAQNQLVQQQLAQSRQATQLGAAQLQKLVEADQRVKQFAEKMRQTGGPEDWRGIAKAMFDSGDPEQIKRAQEMIEDHKASARLNQAFGLGEPEAPPAQAQQMQAPAAPVDQNVPSNDRLREYTAQIGNLENPEAKDMEWVLNAQQRVNNLAPAQTVSVNTLGEKIMPAVEKKSKPLPMLPTVEQGLLMAGSQNKGEAETGKRIVDYYEKQPELLKLQAQQNRLLQMADTPQSQKLIEAMPEYRDITAQIKKITTHAAPIQINTGQQLEKAESVQKGASNIKLLDEVSNDARSSAKLLPAIDVAERIMNKGYETGFGTDAKVAGARLLSAFGVPEATKYASDAATMQAMLTQTVLQRQLEQKGVATEGDAQRIADTSAKLSNPVDANKYILSVARATIQRDQEKKDFFQKWWNTNKTVEGAEQAWDAGPANKSIFTYPALKAYAPATKPTAGPKTPIATAQDKAALDWANANPNDPRAAQIKSRLGQ